VFVVVGQDIVRKGLAGKEPRCASSCPDFRQFLANSFFERIPENVENPNRCINTGVSDWYERAMLTWDLISPP
jgi:hypothetical protein